MLPKHSEPKACLLISRLFWQLSLSKGQEFPVDLDMRDFISEQKKKHRARHITNRIAFIQTVHIQQTYLIKKKTSKKDKNEYPHKYNMRLKMCLLDRLHMLKFTKKQNKKKPLTLIFLLKTEYRTNTLVWNHWHLLPCLRNPLCIHVVECCPVFWLNPLTRVWGMEYIHIHYFIQSALTVCHKNWYMVCF